MNIKKFYYDINQQNNSTFVTQITNAYPIARPMDLGTNSGDILIQLEHKTLLFELKSSVNDFVASIMDRRLFKQAEGMKEISPWAFLLHPEFKYDHNNYLMGVWDSQGYKAHEHWNRNHIEGALTAVQARGVMTRSTYKGLIETLRGILNWANDADSGAVTQEPIKLSPFDKDDQQLVNLLCWFEGIGVKQAKSFMDWLRIEHPGLNRYEAFQLAFTSFEGNNRPIGWTSHTIERNRKQLGFEIEKPKRLEWEEELV